MQLWDGQDQERGRDRPRQGLSGCRLSTLRAHAPGGERVHTIVTLKIRLDFLIIRGANRGADDRKNQPDLRVHVFGPFGLRALIVISDLSTEGYAVY